MILLENVNKSELCDTFNINSILTNDANDISNAFCSYFTNIGQQCASTIGQATSHSSNYLRGNYQNSFFLIPNTPGDIIIIIIIIIMAGMAVFNVAGYLIEERRRWPVITASPRGQCSK